MKHFSAPRLTDMYIFAMVALFPLFVGPGGYVSTTLSKFLFFAILTAVWALWSGILLLKSHPLSVVRCEKRTSALLGAYFLLCCISAACSPYGVSVLFGEGRYDGLITTLLCALVFLGGAYLAKAKAAYLYAALCAGVICCAVGILQLFGLNPLKLFPGSYDYYDAGLRYTGSFFGTIGNADLFSAYLCLLLPIAWAYYITSKKRIFWLLPALAVLSFSLMACRVSAGLLAVALTALLMPPVLITSGGRLRRTLECSAVIFVFLALAACFHGEKADEILSLSMAFSKRASAMLILAAFAAIARLAAGKSEFGVRGLRIFLCCLSVSAVIGALTAVYYAPPEDGTLWELSQMLHGNIQDSFGSARIGIWRAILEVVPHRLLLGGGPGTLALRINLEFTRYVPETGQTLTAFIDNAHNEYLGILANTGLLSLLCRLAAQLVSLVLALRQGSRCALCLIFGLVCYWIQSFFGLGLFIVSPLMWLCWGLLTSELCKPNTKDDG